jgi:hypothetical protein
MVAPGLPEVVADAINTLTDAQPGPQITLILDPGEDAYRVGYGDPKGATLLAALAQRPNVTLRSEPGVRLGLLIADDTILMWAPTPKSVENGPAPSKADGIVPSEPNGIRLDSACNLSEQIDAAVGASAANTVLTNVEIGRESLSAERAKDTVEALEANPPAPVNLSRMARVFSTKVQFVECTLRGAQWTERETKSSSKRCPGRPPATLSSSEPCARPCPQRTWTAGSRSTPPRPRAETRTLSWGNDANHRNPPSDGLV